MKNFVLTSLALVFLASGSMAQQPQSGKTSKVQETPAPIKRSFSKSHKVTNVKANIAAKQKAQSGSQTQSPARKEELENK